MTEFRVITPAGMVIQPDQTKLSRLASNPTLSYEALRLSDGDVQAASELDLLTCFNATNKDYGYLYIPIDNQVSTAHREGAHTIDRLLLRGTLEAEFIVGADGDARGIVEIRNESGTEQILLSLDDQNRPELGILSQGSAVVIYSASGPAVAEGTPLKLRATWDSQTELEPELYATFTYLNGTAPPGSWSNYGSSWNPKVMPEFNVGFSSSLLDFNGSLGVVQLGE